MIANVSNTARKFLKNTRSLSQNYTHFTSPYPMDTFFPNDTRHSENLIEEKRNGLKNPVKSYIFLTFSYIMTDQNFTFHNGAKNQKDVL